jgi:hypothetical protein
MQGGYQLRSVLRKIIVPFIYSVWEETPIFQNGAPPNPGLSVFQGFLLIIFVAFDRVSHLADSF